MCNNTTHSNNSGNQRQKLRGRIDWETESGIEMRKLIGGNWEANQEVEIDGNRGVEIERENQEARSQ